MKDQNRKDSAAPKDLESSALNSALNRPLYYRSKEQWKLEPTDLSKVDSTIVTVPDESMSIMELIDRTQKGLPINANAKTPVYEDTEDFDAPDLEEFHRMDVLDSSNTMQEAMERVNVATKEAQADIARQRKSKEQEEKKDKKE